MSVRAAALMVALPCAAIFLMGANPPGPPWPEVVSPNAITLRWYPDDTSEAAAHSAADAHCAISARHAELAAIQQHGSVTVATYSSR